MRNLLFVITTCSAVGLVASAAYGAQVSIKAKYSSQQLLGACQKAGGTFESTDGAFSCHKENCDGKGGRCSVTCGKNGKCTGATPIATGRGGSFSGNVDAVLTGKTTAGKVRTAPTAGSGSARNPVVRTKPKTQTTLGQATTQPQTASQPRQKRHR